MRIKFFGAAREVTGSNILLDASGIKILIECGLFQGYRLSEERNYAPFAYNPAEIKAVVVGHAHLDHTGRLPKLVKEGFTGTIYMTEPTRDLVELVLLDSEKLMREEAERDNHKPLYGPQDVERTLTLIQTVSYKEKAQIAPGVHLTFKTAGHILGSAVSLIESEDVSLVYTSDLGNNPSALLDPPEFFEKADLLICESTYGGRIHEDSFARTEKLAAIISETIKNNGVLLIPSFAIERTQELLHDIEHFCTVNNCEKPTFYLDSPLADKVTKVYGKYPAYMSKKLNNTHGDFDFFGLDRLKITNSVDESKAINDVRGPKVIIAGSGMMNGGRIIHHARRYLSDEKCSLLFVGYQANGTLGRRIYDGEHQIKIFGEKIEVRAKISAIGSYSAHADMPQLVDWASKIKGLKKAFIVHGENDQSLTLADKFSEEFNIETEVPQANQEYIFGEDIKIPKGKK